VFERATWMQTLNPHLLCQTTRKDGPQTEVSFLLIG
jgi:hypothetical protein